MLLPLPASVYRLCCPVLPSLLLTEDLPSRAAVGGCPAAAAPVAGFAFRLLVIDIHLADRNGSDCYYYDRDYLDQGTPVSPVVFVLGTTSLVCPQKESTVYRRLPPQNWL